VIRAGDDSPASGKKVAHALAVNACHERASTSQA